MSKRTWCFFFWNSLFIFIFLYSLLILDWYIDLIYQSYYWFVVYFGWCEKFGGYVWITKYFKTNINVLPQVFIKAWNQYCKSSEHGLLTQALSENREFIQWLKFRSVILLFILQSKIFLLILKHWQINFNHSWSKELSV